MGGRDRRALALELLAGDCAPIVTGPGELLADLGPLLELLLASIDELLELLLASIDELLELLLAVFASRFDKQKAVSRRAGDRSTGDSASSCSRFDPRAPDFVQQRAAGGELLEDRGPGRAGC